MEFLFPLLIGLLLGGVIIWLYRSYKASNNIVTKPEFETLKLSLQTKETELAVSKDREAKLESDLLKINETLTTLQTSNSKYLEDLSIVRTEKNDIEKRNEELKKENGEYKQLLAEKTNKLTEAQNAIVKLQEEIKSKDKDLSTQQKNFEQIKENLGKEFKLVANNILETNAKTFAEQQTSKLDDLLKPFRLQIETFKKEVDAKFTQDATEKGSLKQQIESLVTLNQSISKEALALTEALKGSTKKQGDWGEDILDRILEYSGLQKNIHYKLQHHATNEEGKSIRPDVVIYYPDKRFLVIDSKVSLSHYWDYCNASNIEDQNACIPKVVDSIKSHIDSLSKKRYTDIDGTPEFIIMFMPVEAAYITALQQDYSLWQYAYDRKVILISPTNLIPAMKMVSVMWDKDAINRNSEKIVAKAVKLYEKFTGFITTFEKVGDDIKRAHSKWDDARGQLYTGRDNFIIQGDKLKKLLANRTMKELPKELIALAETQANVEEVDEQESNELPAATEISKGAD